MKIHYLIPIFSLALNFSGRPLPAKPEAVVSASAGPFKTAGLHEDEKMISWTTDRRLLWDDFLCEPQREGEAVASTSTSLGLSYQVRNNKLTFHITCDFSKEKSWGALKTDYILAHEQGHFDVTEIHARRLYEALYHYEFNPDTFKKDISGIYNRIVKEKEAMQEAYDGNTDHSRRRAIQVNWLEKIDDLLDETQLFSNYP